MKRLLLAFALLAASFPVKADPFLILLGSFFISRLNHTDPVEDKEYANWVNRVELEDRCSLLINLLDAHVRNMTKAKENLKQNSCDGLLSHPLTQEEIARIQQTAVKITKRFQHHQNSTFYTKIKNTLQLSLELKPLPSRQECENAKCILEEEKAKILAMAALPTPSN